MKEVKEKKEKKEGKEEEKEKEEEKTPRKDLVNRPSPSRATTPSSASSNNFRRADAQEFLSAILSSLVRVRLALDAESCPKNSSSSSERCRRSANTAASTPSAAIRGGGRTPLPGGRDLIVQSSRGAGEPSISQHPGIKAVQTGVAPRQRRKESARRVKRACLRGQEQCRGKALPCQGCRSSNAPASPPLVVLANGRVGGEGCRPTTG